MTENHRKCPKCQAAMELGFIIDQSHGNALVSRWVEGTPEKSFWVGLKTRGKDVLEVQTYRCAACGYLESYAPG